MAWWGVLQARVVQVRHHAGVETAWHQPSGSLRQRLPAVNGIARSLSHGATLARPPDPPQPVQLCRQRPGAVLQVLQVAAAVERPAIEVAGPAAPIAGLRRARTGVVGLRPASAAAPLSNPDPGARVISPGRPVFRRVTRSPPLAWLPGSDQPTKQAGTAKSEPYRAHSPYSQAVGPAGRVWVRPAARRHNGRRLLHDGAPDRPAGDCPAWVGLARPTNWVVESPLEPFLTTGWHANGPVQSWEQHIDDEER